MAHLTICKSGVINLLGRPFFGNVAIRTLFRIVVHRGVILVAIYATRKVFVAE